MSVSKKYSVLTCDIIRSRNFDYPELADVVNGCIKHLKRRFRDIFYAYPELVFGDSIQMVLAEPGLSLTVFDELEECLWLAGRERFACPVKIRCGIGIGSIISSSKKIGEMSGDAFLNARNALNSIKKTSRYSFVAISVEDQQKSEWFSAIVGVASALKSHWTFAQRRAILKYREFQSLKKAGDQLNKPRQEISELLKRANFSELYRLEKAMENILW